MGLLHLYCIFLYNLCGPKHQTFLGCAPDVSSNCSKLLLSLRCQNIEVVNLLAIDMFEQMTSINGSKD